ncbi:hypothetical protein BPOR_0495g00070 [Botrytis porri]|uniref:Uncharacterized protein n=1 Tax=Botrytis porri TaxID=87229 RepID=A0A4Z1KEQ2_9HELO|nr:hypothetical protein BPOR_0495g00070 [Botrytis porri]
MIGSACAQKFKFLVILQVSWRQEATAQITSTVLEMEIIDPSAFTRATTETHSYITANTILEMPTWDFDVDRAKTGTQSPKAHLEGNMI